MTPELLEKIKSRGYWRINLQPLVKAEKLPSIDRCQEIVEQNAVKLRGWEYPAILQGAPDVQRTRTQTYFELANDWQNHIEFWRMYRSGQFLHYLALREDWISADELASMGEQQMQPMTRLSVVGTIYSVTEIHEFAARLARAGLYNEGVVVSIGLHHTKDRVLWLEDRARVGFSYERKTGAEELTWSQSHTKEQLVEDPPRLSRVVLKELFDAFGWQVADELLGRDQERLLTQRF